MIPRSSFFKQLVQAQMPEYYAKTYGHSPNDSKLLNKCEKKEKINSSVAQLQLQSLNNNTNVNCNREINQKKRRFPCHLCNRSYTTSSNRTYHIRKIHMDERPFHCKLCDHRSTAAHRLRDHMRKRHKIFEKAYKCDGCQKEFIYLRDKTAHAKNCAYFRLL